MSANPPSPRRWLQFRMASLFVLMAAAAGIFAFLWARQPYVATVLLLVQFDDPWTSTARLPQRPNVSPEQLMRSQKVLSRALQDPSITQLRMVPRRADPAAWLQEQLVVDRVGMGGQVLRVRLAGRDEAETKALLDAIVNSCIVEASFDDDGPLSIPAFLFGIQILKRASDDW